MDNGRCFVLLGQNGAGKSTTINMLTGLYAPTHGHAFVFGYSVGEDMEELQSIVGVCPQHDVLWPELTATDHFSLFAR